MIVWPKFVDKNAVTIFICDQCCLRCLVCNADFLSVTSYLGQTRLYADAYDCYEVEATGIDHTPAEYSSGSFGGNELLTNTLPERLPTPGESKRCAGEET